MNFMTGLKWIGGFSAVTLVMGCSATHTAINKRKLDVQTKMSSTLFLDPVLSADKRTIFVQLRNTSDKQELCIEPRVLAILQEKGYTLARDPAQAHYLLQANILQVGRTDLRAAEHALSGGFGAALSGAALGAAVGSLGGHQHNSNRMVASGLLGAAVSTVADAAIQDVFYSVVADVQISEKVGNTVLVKEKTKSKLKQGENGTKEITSTERVDWKRYQTRIVGTANKVNLKFQQAEHELTRGLVNSITGIF
jgi:hypothetical protein